MRAFFRPFWKASNNYDEIDSDEPDLESGRKSRRSRRSITDWRNMLHFLRLRLQQGRKPSFISHILYTLIVLSVLLFLLVFGRQLRFKLSEKEVTLPIKHYPYGSLSNLVTVAGHSVYTSHKCQSVEGESSWYLESYQRHAGQAASFVQHIRAGTEAAAHDDDALLIFSGGETRKEAGPRSEAQSYWSVADSKDWFGMKDVKWRALTEEHARDSYENLLFSICRFRELTGHYPHNITVVSYSFKEHRFSQLHRAAIRFPASRFMYVGTPPSVLAAASAAEGELRVQEQFQNDPYGCTGSLQQKRWKRDPFLRTIPYPAGCPEIADLFSYCGKDLYDKELPWNKV
ncbi:hypothetical protein O6H91_07G041400 [Diphasiastrum complanatum]|uniref:Uncharacterized protein n=1 Tax=Diphasiastrum complanatum TaxID=34168 RepID=A0ACC2D4R2_DIPCM|nr:hypothetical protein O6H91_07G041400 [Diphasiastrum complanatum]